MTTLEKVGLMASLLTSVASLYYSSHANSIAAEATEQANASMKYAACIETTIVSRTAARADLTAFRDRVREAIDAYDRYQFDLALRVQQNGGIGNSNHLVGELQGKIVTQIFVLRDLKYDIPTSSGDYFQDEIATLLDSVANIHLEPETSMDKLDAAHQAILASVNSELSKSLDTPGVMQGCETTAKR